MNHDNLISEYLKNAKTTYASTSFMIPMQDYLELCGISPEDAYWFGDEILDIMNGEGYEDI